MPEAVLGRGISIVAGSVACSMTWYYNLNTPHMSLHPEDGNAVNAHSLQFSFRQSHLRAAPPKTRSRLIYIAKGETPTKYNRKGRKRQIERSVKE